MDINDFIPDSSFIYYVSYFAFCEEFDCYVLWHSNIMLKSDAEKLCAETDGVLRKIK